MCSENENVLLNKFIYELVTSELVSYDRGW